MALTQVKGSAFPEEQTLQPGMVMMWAGNENQIPTGWKLCNGSGSTSNGIQVPDLRNRFVIGSGSSYDTGDTGGASSHTTSTDGSHSHTITVNSGGNHSHTVTVDGTTLSSGQMPKHTHKHRTPGGNNFRYVQNNGGWAVGGGFNHNDPFFAQTPNQEAATGSSQSHTHSASTASNTGSHTHSASSNNTGNHNHTVTTVPPYYALAYIIKL